jgi:hypothetical protein
VVDAAFGGYVLHSSKRIAFSGYALHLPMDGAQGVNELF